MHKQISFLLTTALCAALTAGPALADEGRWHDDRGHHDRGHFEHGEHVEHGDAWRWHGDIHHFHVYDYDHWRGGHWWHGFHEGRGGWWWLVGDFWYFYPAPVYPFPDPYTPPAVVVEPMPASPLGAAPSYVYYCSNPAGYYPYVSQCFSPWERTTSTVTVINPPEPAPAIAVPPPQPMSDSQRDRDDRELNQLGVEFQHVNLAGPHARRDLKRLEKKVEAFRETLYARAYNATDIIRDADRLEHRIAEQRERAHK